MFKNDALRFLNLLKLVFITLCFGIGWSGNLQVYGQGHKVDSSEMRTLRIDPESARGAALSQFFEEVNFIPLETTKESLFGSISFMKITEKYFILYDYDTKAVLIFDRAGKYVNKISAANIEKDPEDKNDQTYFGFELVKDNGEDHIVVTSSKYIHHFSLDGKKIKKVLRKDSKIEWPSRTFSDGTKVETDYMVKEGQDSAYYEISLVKDKKGLYNFFPYSPDRYNDDQFYSVGQRVSDYGVQDELFYIDYYTYNLYKIKPGRMSLAYRVLFPLNNTLPADFKTNPEYKGKRSEFFQRNPKMFYGIGDAYEIGANLYFRVKNWSWEPAEKKVFIFDLKTGALFSLADLEPDSVSQFLPATDLGVGYEFSNKGFMDFKDGYFYTSYSSLAMFRFKEQSEGKQSKYSAALAEYFKTQDKKSNPVIIELKPRKN